MSEEFILNHIPERVKQLGFRNYHIRYRDLTIKAGAIQRIPAYTELWFITDDPSGLIVESDYGIYDTTGVYLSDNSHEHKGEIVIENPGGDNKRIKFIQVIIIN
jgi:hypothetical protein